MRIGIRDIDKIIIKLNNLITSHYTIFSIGITRQAVIFARTRTYLSRISHPAGVCELPGGGVSVREIAIKHLFENYKLADEMLAERDYFFDHFTAPDAHFF